MPLISIIIFWNGREKNNFVKTFKSIQSQTFTDFEILLITRKQSSLSFFSETFNDTRIKALQYHLPMPEAINKCIEEASGEFISIIEPSVYCLPEKLEKQINFLSENPDIALVASSVEYIDKKNNPIATSETRTEHHDIIVDMLHENCFVDSSVVFRKRSAIKAEKLNKDLRYFYYYDFWLRIALDNKLASINEILCKKEISRAKLLSITKRKIAVAKELLKKKVSMLLSKANLRTHQEMDMLAFGKRSREKNKIRERFIGRYQYGKLEILKESLSIYIKDSFLYYTFIKYFRIYANLTPKPIYKDMKLFLNKMKCIRYPYDELHFNTISDAFMQYGNPYISFLCNLKSLSNNPYQKDIYNKASQYADNPVKLFIPLQKKVTCLVSVIMPTYNRPFIIKESIESVLKQTLGDFEIIIVNDGGSIDVEDTIANIDSDKIKYYRIKHAGLSATLNEALKVAQGKYIAYLDDDDIYYPEHLDKLYNFIEAEKTDIVYSKSLLVKGHYEKDRFIREKELGTYTMPYSEKMMRKTCIISTLNVMHTREALKVTGGFNRCLPWSMDWDHWVRFSENFPVKFLNEFTGEYRIAGQNMTARTTYKAEFYMNCMLRNYYMSNNGLSILAAAAYYCEDKNGMKRYLEKLDGNIDILSIEELKRLRKIGAINGFRQNINLLIGNKSNRKATKSGK